MAWIYFEVFEKKYRMGIIKNAVIALLEEPALTLFWLL